MVAQEVPTSTAVALPHGPAGVAEARRRLRTDLYARGVPEPVVDDAVLILSELISNSCRHARPLGDDVLDGLGASRAGSGTGSGTGDTMRTPEDRAGVQTPARHPGRPQRPERDPRPQGRILAAWSVDDGGMLVLEVTDGGGPTRPRPSSPSLTAHGGRGLGIVGSLALRWGVRDAPGEVTVWAQLPVRGRHARRDTPMGTGIGLPLGVPLGLPLDLAESLDDLG
ncbi:ATP-binding protein [Actinacidiphila sp. bgisy145]|uniref:ATP-binding protein n=1 Tax=Actinacidiphila sp. bgisy145 TaxID=3413792 RepID=UPI003EBAA35C